MAYHGVLQAQLGYSLGTTTFTTQQLKPIQTITDQAYKPKIGLNRNFPTAVLQGPLEYNGLSTTPLITTQGFKHTQLLIGSLRNEDDTGNLTNATLQYEQLKSGLTTPILRQSTIQSAQSVSGVDLRLSRRLPKRRRERCHCQCTSISRRRRSCLWWSVDL